MHSIPKHIRCAVRCISAAALAITLWGGVARADTAKPLFPTRAPVAQYLEKNRADEIALARSAAPASISSEAEVLVLGSKGFETAVKGKNGFVCLVERSWDANFDSPGFWNPNIRGPDCLNPISARTELPQFLKRAEWALSGLSKDQMVERTKSAFGDGSFRKPEAGAMALMLSKGGHIGDDAAGPWLPHVMLFVPHGQAATWTAGAEGSPVLGQEGSEIESTVLFIPVRQWSDGSLAPVPTQPHTHG